ncbi:MAG TPA: zf-HC2 domain-containing protein [Pyrinomonadaceae bacterium]
MSKEINNEIDLLLRRMGRRDHDVARSVEARADDRHLDTDELSSYAQNALPAAARARYTEHLAECATCRRLVTELSLSLGAAATSVAAAHEPSGLKKFLASLMSPLVLRYAVPALGVIVVMVVGFVVLRQQRRQEFTAQLQEAKPAPAAAPSESAPNFGLVDKQAQVGDKAESRDAKPDNETKRKSEAVAGNASGAASAAASAPVTKDGPIDEMKSAPTATPAAAAPPKAAATIEETAVKTDAAAKKQEEQPKTKPADEDAVAPAPPTRGLSTLEPAGRTAQNVAKPGSSDTHGFIGGVAAARPQAAAKRAERKETEKRTEKENRDDANRAEAQDASNETKTIAGRHFRKQGGIWTDTAYDSSTATVNMARSSEQFRALVADEPAIGTIAKQLEGEVIVVWKGRAYHIR